MFRRSLAFFCLPCGRETDIEDLRVIAVCDEDADPVEFSPQEHNVVRLQFRLGPGQEEDVPPMAHVPQKTLSSVDAANISLEERPSLRDTEEEELERISGKVDAAVPSCPDAGASSGQEAPPAARRRRGCRRCWAERLAGRAAVRPRGRQGYRPGRR